MTSGIGVLLGCGADVLLELHNAKVRTVQDLKSTIDLIGTNEAGALAFGDPLNAEKLLQALRTRPHIRGAAMAAHNVAEVRNVAHAFKGMLANLSANPASAAAARLEELAKEGRTDELPGALQAFERELDGVLLEVEHLLAGALK